MSFNFTTVWTDFPSSHHVFRRPKISFKHQDEVAGPWCVARLARWPAVAALHPTEGGPWRAHRLRPNRASRPSPPRLQADLLSLIASLPGAVKHEKSFRSSTSRASCTSWSVKLLLPRSKPRTRSRYQRHSWDTPPHVSSGPAGCRTSQSNVM